MNGHRPIIDPPEYTGYHGAWSGHYELPNVGTALSARRIALQSDDLAAINDAYLERGWSDGLPIIPPTPERVDQMLSGIEDPREVVCVLPPRNGEATLESIAINAVMAGCRPDSFLVVVGAVRALSHPDFNLHSIQVTTHPASPLVIVNGPIRSELGLNGGAGCFGPGFQANATIGRAVRLVLLNIGGGSPGDGDRATHGHPGKFTYCIAENQEENPWEPLHVERGFDEQSSTVTVIGGEAPHNINNHVGETAGHILNTCADSMCTLGTNNPFSTKSTEMTLILGPEHAATIASDGWTKEDVKHFLYERARRSVRDLMVGGLWGMHSWPKWFEGVSEDDTLPVVSHPDNFLVVVAGGDGKHSACVPTTGSTRSVTVEI